MSWFSKKPKAEYIPNEDRWWHYPLFALCFLVIPIIAPLILFDLLGESGAGLLSIVLVVMTGIMVSWRATIQELRKELFYTRDKLDFYQSAWSRLRSKCPTGDKEEWYEKYFCDRCHQDQGRYWPPSNF